LDELATPQARLYAEAEQPLQGLGSWSVVKQGRAGQVFFHLLERA
jgi:16S rRNA (guanine966-N2)-methyltransferase